MESPRDHFVPSGGTPNYPHHHSVYTTSREPPFGEESHYEHHHQAGFDRLLHSIYSAQQKSYHPEEYTNCWITRPEQHESHHLQQDQFHLLPPQTQHQPPCQSYQEVINQLPEECHSYSNHSVNGYGYQHENSVLTNPVMFEQFDRGTSVFNSSGSTVYSGCGEDGVFYDSYQSGVLSRIVGSVDERSADGCGQEEEEDEEGSFEEGDEEEESGVTEKEVARIGTGKKTVN